MADPQLFWWLTRSGARLVEGASPAPGKATPNPLFLRHTAAIAGLYVALLDLGPNIGMHCESCALSDSHLPRRPLPMPKGLPSSWVTERQPLETKTCPNCGQVIPKPSKPG